MPMQAKQKNAPKSAPIKAANAGPDSSPVLAGESLPPLELGTGSKAAFVQRITQAFGDSKFLDRLVAGISTPALKAAIRHNPEAFLLGQFKVLEVPASGKGGEVQIKFKLDQFNPDTRYEFNRTARRYLFESSKDANLAEIKRLASVIPPINNACRLSICIPAAAHEEGQNIYHCLQAFLNQTALPRYFEIVILANHPTHDKENARVKRDSTLSEILRFKEEHPELNVHFAYGTCENASMSIGLMRKLLTDTVLYRLVQSKMARKDHILVSSDADLRGVTPHYVKNYIELFDRNRNVDSFSGIIDYDPVAYTKNPLLYIGCRVWGMIDAANRVYGDDPQAPGANFAFRASSYAATGGYDELRAAEDVCLGKKFKLLRAGAKKHTAIEYANARSKIFSSARRAIKAIEVGLSPIEQWSQRSKATAFGPNNKSIRSGNHSNIDRFESQMSDPHFLKNVENVINRTLSVFWVGDRPLNPHAKRLIARILTGHFKLQYKFSGNKQIKITDISGLQLHLRKYRANGVKIFTRYCEKPE